MKNYIFILLINLSLLSFTNAQLVYNQCPDFYIENGASFTVQGSLKNDTGGFITNNGTIDISGNLENKNSGGGFNGSGTLILSGGNQQFKGDQGIKLYTLIIAGNGTKKISSVNSGYKALTIYQQLNLSSAVLDLNSRFIEISNGSPAAVTYSNGSIKSESIDGSPNENLSYIRWKISNNTGLYTLPFVSATNVSIPLKINIITAGSSDGFLDVSTYPTKWDNTPYADNPRIKNMDVDRFTSMPKEAFNRFWRINFGSYLIQPHFDLSFTYDDQKDLCKNNSCNQKIGESDIAAVRWSINDSSWYHPYFNGSVDTLNNTFTVSNISNSNSWWTLTENKTYPYPFEEICIVTVDSNTNKNLISWERTAGVYTAAYNIYKENTLGQYQKIGTVAFDSLPVFIDSNSSPKVKADRYKISTVDTNGLESPLSTNHKTIHLTASSGTSGENNLSWSHYEGFSFSSYKIYRGTSAFNMTLLDSIQYTLNSYSDINPPSSGIVYYMVIVDKQDTCYPSVFRAQTTSGPFSHSVSNIKDYNQPIQDFLNVSPSSQTINSSSGSTANFTVITNLSDWYVTNKKSWLNVSKNITNGTITAVADENTLSTSRIDTITVSGQGVQNVKIYVIQNGSSSSDYLNVSPATVYLDDNAGSDEEFSVSTNLSSWDVVSDQSWLDVSKDIPGGKITVTANEANLNTSARNATVTVSGQGVPDVDVTVVQNGTNPSYYLNISPPTLTIDSDIGSNGEFSISTNLSSWDASSNESWVVITEDIANGKISVTAAETNTSSSARSATITVSGSGINDQTALVIQNGVSSVAEQKLNNLKVFPNPFSDMLNVSFELREQSDIDILVVNLLGENVYLKHIPEGSGKQQFEIPMTAYSTGTYFIKIITDNQISVVKLIKN